MNKEKKLSLKYYPNSILREQCKEVDEDEEISGLLEGMRRILEENEGMGLAAPQVGVDKQVVLYYDLNKFKEEPEVILNPVIVDREGGVEEEEGCLSFPDLYVDITRPAKVTLEAYFLEDDERKKVEHQGMMARVVSHEVEHLNGVLIIDHLSSVKRELIKGKLKEISELSDAEG